jgi:hypothetical protein
MGMAMLTVGVVLTGCIAGPDLSGQQTPDEVAPQSYTPLDTGATWAIVTDFGNCDDGERQVADMVAAWNPEIVATAGDNTQGLVNCIPYTQSVGDYYASFVSGPDGPRMFPVPGNHDYENEGAGESAYLDYFAYLGAFEGGGRWYKAEIGHTNLFMLDSELGTAAMDEQRAWLQQSLTQARDAEPQDWNIVIFHRPVFTSGPHEPNTAMRPAAGWDYRGWGADLVIAGHQHVYEELEVDGLPYLVAGVGASDIARACPAQLVEESDGCVEGYGAILVTESESLLTLDYRAPDGAGGRSLGTLEIGLSG